MGEKNSVPAIRFVGFTDDWEQRELGEIAEIVGGGTPSTGNPQYWDGNIDWYAPAEIADQIYLESSQRKITELGYDSSSAKILPPGTVLFTSRAGIGKTAILTRKGCTNQGFQSIVPHKGELDSYFIFSRTEELKRYGELVGAGSTFVEVSGKQMAAMELMMPSTMREQQQIGTFFCHLDHLITLHQRKYSRVCNIKKSMFERMFPREGATVPEIRFAGFMDAWEQRKLPELLKNGSSAMKIGPFGSALRKEVFVEEGVKVYAQENVFTGDFSIGDYYITEEKYRELQSCELYPGDLVISMMGTIGCCAIFPKTARKGIMNSHLLRLQFNNKVIPEYIMFLLKDSDLIRAQIERLSVGSIMSGLSSSIVKKLIFSVPKIEEQKKIVDYLKLIDHLITLHQRELERLQNIKKACLEKMFV